MVYHVEEKIRARLDAIEARLGLTETGRPTDLTNLTREVDTELKSAESRLLNLIQKVQTDFDSRFSVLEGKVSNVGSDYTFLERKLAEKVSPMKSSKCSDRAPATEAVPSDIEERLFDLEKTLHHQAAIL
jgi:hypothetical protein